MRVRIFRRALILISVISLILPVTSVAQGKKITKVRIWVNAYIPKYVKTAGPSKVLVVRNGPHKGETAVNGPISAATSGLFLTDQRNYSNNPLAASRLHALAEIDVANEVLTTETTRTDPTIRIGTLEAGLEDCDKRGGSDVKVLDFSKQLFASGGKQFQFRLKGSAHNPCVDFPANESADIDCDILVKLSVDSGGETGRVSVTGFIEAFPSFEMYVSRNDESGIPVFTLEPAAGTTLGDLSGAASRKLEDEFGKEFTTELGESLDGVWVSTDAAHRFQVQIKGNDALITETKINGEKLVRSSRLDNADGTFRIERPNNNLETLTYLGLKTAIGEQVLARAVGPSYMVLSFSDGKLEGTWFELQVKQSKGKLKGLFEPGTRPPLKFQFVRQD